jgi:tetratricopeptide (TPR) repeat protein
MKHLEERELADLIAGRLAPAQWRRAIHHLSGCARCSTKLTAPVPERLLEQSKPVGGGVDYEAAFERAAAKLAEHEAHWRKDQEKLARGLSLLRDNPQGYYGLSLQQVKSLRGWPLVEALLERSYELRFSDRKQMKWLAYNAVLAAEGLQPEEYRQAFIFDARAQAWSELGNAYRVNEEFGTAEHAFGKTREMLSQGTGDLLLLARAAKHEANLKSDQRKLREAGELLEAAYQIYLGLGEHHLAGEALISRARTLTIQGDPRGALPLHQLALELLDPESEPLVASVAYHGFLDTLVLNGELTRAGRLLLRSGLRQTFAAQPRLLLSVRWLEARLLAGFGELRRAEQAFYELQTEFLDRGFSYDAALVGLDLAPVWLKQGRAGRVRKLSQEMLDTFRELGIESEATKALHYLRQT